MNKVRALIVDDSAVMRKIVERSLRQAGIELEKVVEAGNGAEALGVLRDNAVDLILCDINMPVMDGVRPPDGNGGERQRGPGGDDHHRHDVFQALTGVIQAMQSNSGFDAAIVSLRGAFDYVSAERVFYGNTLNQAQSQATYLNSAKLQLSQQENALVGADIEAAASRLVNAENATNATLAAVGRISQLSLFDYLK